METETMKLGTATAVISTRTELEAALDQRGLPFVSILYRTHFVSRDGLLVTGRVSGVESERRYPQGIKHICSKTIRPRKSYREDIIRERIAEAAQGIGPFAGLTEKEIRKIGYDVAPLHRGFSERVGPFLAEHTIHGTIYFRYSLDQKRGGPEVRAANWERWVNCETGQDLSDAEFKAVKADYLKVESKTPKQKCEYDRMPRTIKATNLLQIVCGEVYAFDSANFKIGL
jgi:hypothetical protein